MSSLQSQAPWTVARVRRAAGIAVGLGAQIMFAATVVGLYLFLANAGDDAGRGDRPFALVDLLLAISFAAPHSVLRLPAVQRAVSRRVGREFYGACYCWATCLSLWLVFLLWRPGGGVVWNVHGVAASTIHGAFLACWGALAYSLHLTGIGYQTGYTEWSAWLRREPPAPRQFAPRGAYCVLRHPVYLSFLGLIWLNPRMTVDHLLLALVWTTYLAIGSYLKDERLALFVGEDYRRYQARVPGYPLVFWGPLGVRRTTNAQATGVTR